MKFKTNLHLAKHCSLEGIERDIKRYPKKYFTPKYLMFMKRMLEDKWKVRIYEAGVSKYIFVIKGQEIFKIRFSNHPPHYIREFNNDCDFYVGVSHKQVSTTEEIIEKLQSYSDAVVN